MNIKDLYTDIKDRFLAIEGISDLLDKEVTVIADTAPETTLMPEGYVPSAAKKGEYKVTAQICGSKGEAYTQTPADFHGTLKEAIDLPVSDKGISAAAIASINAAMSYLGLCNGVFPDDPDTHSKYAAQICDHARSVYNGKNIILVGYDGYIVKKFMDEKIDFWTMDRDPDNIAQDRFNHVVVNSGRYNRESCFSWGKLFIITGSAFCNGTITQYLDQGKDIMLYGITASGIAALLDLPIFR